MTFQGINGNQFFNMTGMQGMQGNQGQPPKMPPEVKEQLKSASLSDEEIQQLEAQGPEALKEKADELGIQLPPPPPPPPKGQNGQSNIFGQQNGICNFAGLGNNSIFNGTGTYNNNNLSSILSNFSGLTGYNNNTTDISSILSSLNGSGNYNNNISSILSSLGLSSY